MKMICTVVVFVFWISTGIVQGQTKDFEEFYKPEEMLSYKGIISVYCQKERVYLEIPEKYLNREMLVTAQVNRGAKRIGRPLQTIGVFCFVKEEDGRLFLQKSKYAERIVDRKSSLAPLLANSTRPAINEVFEIVSINPENQGYIIDITEVLKGGDGWFGTQIGNLRSGSPGLKLEKVETEKDGMVFTLAKQYVDIPSWQAVGVKQMEGKISVEIGCMLRILPGRPMEWRFAKHCPGFETVCFIEYGKNPYGVMKDSIIQRWRMENGETGQIEPIVFYIDTACPEIWRPWIKKAVSDWKQVFEQVGMKDRLQVCMADESQNTVKYRALISYDLSTPFLKSEKMVHPETGEILSCRINIGHGVLDVPVKRYLLQYGAIDNRIMADFENVEVAGEILCAMLTREIGRMLGLKYDCSAAMGIASVMNRADDLLPLSTRKQAKHFVPEISAYDKWMIKKGYGACQCSDKIDFVQEANGEIKSEQKLVENKLAAVERRVQWLNDAYNQLEKRIINDRRIYNSQNYLTQINRVGQELYQQYMSLIVKCIEKSGSKAMEALQHHLFARVSTCPSFTALPNNGAEWMEDSRWSCCKNVVNEICRPALWKSLLAPAAEYHLSELLSDIHRLVFSDFVTTKELTAFEMNLQSYYISMLLEHAKEENDENCDTDYQIHLYLELKELQKQCMRLSQNLSATFTGDFYEIWARKIARKIHLE